MERYEILLGFLQGIKALTVAGQNTNQIQTSLEVSETYSFVECAYLSVLKLEGVEVLDDLGRS